MADTIGGPSRDRSGLVWALLASAVFSGLTTRPALATCDTTTTTTTVAPVCGNGVIEPGEVCDCAGGPNVCQPFPDGSGFGSGSCPPVDGRLQYCQSDCTACLPAPRCGDGVYDPGDTCDYAYGILNDQCPPGSRCILTDPCRCYP